MHGTPEQIDEYILAAYLSGKLPERLRKEIVVYLAENAGARELLGMAGDALEVLESGDGAPIRGVSTLPKDQDSSVEHEPPAIEAPAPPVKRFENNRTIWRIVSLIAAAVLVMAITLVLHLISEMEQADTAALPVATEQWQPEIGLDNLTVSWQPVEDARTYHLIVFDPVNDQAITQTETTGTSVERILAGLNVGSLDQGVRFMMWIEAFDDEGQFLQASSRVALTRTADHSRLGEELP